jgi:hypothetical protein
MRPLDGGKKERGRKTETAIDGVDMDTQREGRDTLTLHI